MIKKKVIGKLRLNPNLNIQIALKEAAKSKNSSIIRRTGLTPSQQTNPILEPFVRSRLFPKPRLRPFSAFMKEQMRRQKFLAEPNEKLKENYDHQYFPIGSVVYLNFEEKYRRRYFTPHRGRLFIGMSFRCLSSALNS